MTRAQLGLDYGSVYAGRRSSTVDTTSAGARTTRTVGAAGRRPSYSTAPCLGLDERADSHSDDRRRLTQSADVLCGDMRSARQRRSAEVEGARVEGSHATVDSVTSSWSSRSAGRSVGRAGRGRRWNQCRRRRRRRSCVHADITALNIN